MQPLCSHTEVDWALLRRSMQRAWFVEAHGWSQTWMAGKD